ncbi:MAG: AAA-like domain-containing protein [Calothrix sp. MO_167.B12]|nr:AAA-like domain-containing protein [Calothrix sp. MO_167.B12]
MNQKSPVPRLDLAPKLKRPLSLWNPLDYLRLLYWVFYFPQALRWYVDTFGDRYIPEEEINWRKGLELLLQNTIQRHLFLQGLILIIITRLTLNKLIQQIDVSIDGFFTALGVALGLALFGVAKGLPYGVLFGMAFVVVFGVLFIMTGNVALFGVAFGVPFGVALGLALFGMVKGTARFLALLSVPLLDVPLGVLLGMVLLGVAKSVPWFGVVFGGVAFGGVVFGMVLFRVAESMAKGLPFGIALVGAGVAGTVTLFGANVAKEVTWFGVAGAVAILRPENWLISLPFNLRNLHKGHFLIPHVTPLSLPYVSVRLFNWLQQDWEAGLHNINQLLTYTLQFIPVVQGVNKALAKTPPKHIIWCVSRLAEAPVDWELVRSASTALWDKNTIRLDTPVYATAAGFWHLHQKEPAKAEEAFAVVRSLPYGEEMYILAQTLDIFHQAKKVITIVAIKLLSLPYQKIDKERLLRPNTWQAIASLHRVIEDIQVVQRSVSRATRAFALNHAQGVLTNIINRPETLPEAERGLIIEIAQNWQKALLQVAGEVGEISITQPVRNPYIIGDPVLGERFVGREDVMRQLEELWVMSEFLQSVVIYGHRRMGKTSILRNAANSVGSGVQVAYINMLNAGNISQGVGEVLMAICDTISETANLPPPSDADLLNLPYRTFERYLKQIVETQLIPSEQGLIIALDEFEKIEELIAAEKIPPDFMGYLRGLVQMYSQVAFAFAGLHTLEEMTADYFQPFFASVIPIHVGFMERAATRQILANPVDIGDIASEDFPLDCTPEALDQIYHLTHGQPYLVQLVGFQLVRRYNDQVFEMGHSRDPIFTVDDVEAVVNPEFFKRGRYYFDGVWSQAAQDVAGQQEILRALAPHPQGLSLQELGEVTGINYEDAQDSLGTLERHDVVKENQGRWQIVVELFRRWVLQQ